MKNLRSYSFLIILLLASCKKNTTQQRVQTLSENYNQAWVYRDSSKLDSAYISFSKAKDEYLGRKDSIGFAKSLINMAEIAYLNGDYFGSQELATQVDSYLDSTKKVERELLSSNYNTLGNVSNGLERYEEANTFFKKAILYTKNAAALNLYYNNIGVDLLYLKRYGEAISYFSKSAGDESSSTSAMKLSNIAKAKWQQNPDFNPVPLFKKALSIRLSDNNLRGQNASHAHLADYYMAIKSDSAIIHAYKMYEIAKKINSPDNQLEALQKLIKLSPSEQSKTYFDIYQKLEDSVQTTRSTAKNQFALIRYETEKSKADNLVLQKDNEEKKYQLLFLISGIVLLGTGSIIWYRKRKQRLKLEAENAIRQNQLKTSKKVHDKVANKIYRVISEVENKDDLDRNHLLDQLEHIYNTSRDISYEITDSQQSRTFSQQLSAMFSAYISNTRFVEVTNNEDELWANVPENTKAEIFIILLELMTNVKKHSQATSVKIRFHKNQNIISINYHDNGIGLPKNVIYNNGLKNTETRIKNISGTITFESTNKSGLEILISFAAN
ncbi:tetratricopeptide repeat-containing sensor histidine kinase [Pedobacter rhodius]|uniref:histidine kinase n=1 Tax=Pedobacter rhodius TaxID=3004098 RepID=A0ABT4L4H6_9SPHI|nr:tetratricopeptide repeat-containing sensor histidine kinase [Pedobacter sp. SJ11]MCZ4224968.1 ATP-binding protein [Pedobacter sp. SJ11]